ncbi:hypothetical protein QYF36_010144 [Acer negundo]|nr:hypothetical protein QYF36_010144 [Acer negundo]
MAEEPRRWRAGPPSSGDLTTGWIVVHVSLHQYLSQLGLRLYTPPLRRAQKSSLNFNSSIDETLLPKEQQHRCRQLEQQHQRRRRQWRYISDLIYPSASMSSDLRSFLAADST